MKKALKTILRVLMVLLNIFLIGMTVLGIVLGTADGSDYMYFAFLLLVDIPMWIQYRRRKQTL